MVLLRLTRQTLLACLATLLAILLSLLLLELGAGLLFRPLTGESFDKAHSHNWLSARLLELDSRSADPDSTSALLYRFHPYVGYVGRPGMRPWPQPYPPFNAHGMLSVAGHEFPYEPAPGDVVIAVLGGSVAEGFANLGGEAALQAQLQTLRPDWQGRVVLICLATGGYKQPQQLFHLQTALLSGFRFHGVINLDGLNELVAVNNNLDRGVHPVYPSQLHTALMAEAYQGSGMDPGTAEMIASSYRLRRRETSLLTLLQDTPLIHSRFVTLLARVWSEHNREHLASLLAMATDTASNAMRQDFRGPPFAPVDDPHALAANLWADSSRLLQAVADSFDLVYLHMLQPNQYVADSKPLSEEELRTAYAPDSEIARIVRAGYPALQAAGQQLADEGIAFHDLSRVFATHPETLYWDICCHFTPAGNEIIAAAIGAPLLALLDEM